MSGVRATKSGFAAEAQAKMNSKYDADYACEAMCWINRMVMKEGEAAINTSGDVDNVFATLSDGFLLCKLAKAIGVNVGGFKREKMAFKKMECINKFLQAATDFGVQKNELFQTVDLYEQQNMTQVVIAVHALGRKVKSKGGDGIGPKEAERQSREWTDEQLKAGQNIIGLQMGTNKGASQAGQSFGKQRMIID